MPRYSNKRVQTVNQYLVKNFNGNRRFMADANNTSTGHVRNWEEKGWIVIDGVLYAPRRKLFLDD